MADKFVNYTGLSHFLQKLKTLLSTKQDTLVSGTNIKTVAGESVLGSGNISAGNASLGIAPMAVDGTFTNGNLGEEIVLSNATDTSQILIRSNGSQGARLSQNILPTKTYVDNALGNKQNTLVSGTNIKTINNQTLLGSGNIDGLATEEYVNALTGDLSALTTDNKGNLVASINEIYEKSGEPFRVKQWRDSTINITIPTCTTDIDNTQIAKMVFSITGQEGIDYQIVGMIAYEVFERTSGKRINCWPVCQFTGNGQKELGVRWMCSGTTAKTAGNISAWVLLKHR